MDPIDYVYVALAVAFALVLTYMVVYNLRIKGREKTLKTMGRPPVSKEEGIAIATGIKEQEQKHTLN